MTAELDKLNGDQTIAEQTTDLTPIEQYVADNLPVIPTTTSAEWCEYTSKHFTGWPTQANPYESCQPSGTNNGRRPAAPTNTSCSTSSRSREQPGQVNPQYRSAYPIASARPTTPRAGRSFGEYPCLP